MSSTNSTVWKRVWEVRTDFKAVGGVSCKAKGYSFSKTRDLILFCKGSSKILQNKGSTRFSKTRDLSPFLGLRKDREGCEILTTSKTEIQNWLLDSCIQTRESLCVIKVGPRTLILRFHLLLKTLFLSNINSSVHGSHLSFWSQILGWVHWIYLGDHTFYYGLLLWFSIFGIKMK